MIRCQCFGESTLLHDHKAGTVNQGPILNHVAARPVADEVPGRDTRRDGLTHPARWRPKLRPSGAAGRPGAFGPRSPNNRQRMLRAFCPARRPVDAGPQSSSEISMISVAGMNISAKYRAAIHSILRQSRTMPMNRIGKKSQRTSRLNSGRLCSSVVSVNRNDLPKTVDLIQPFCLRAGT